MIIVPFGLGSRFRAASGFAAGIGGYLRFGCDASLDGIPIFVGYSKVFCNRGAGRRVTPSVELKAALRRDAMLRRPAFDPDAARALADHFLASVKLPPGAIVAGVWPIRKEIDLRPLLTALHVAGHQIVLPETPPRGTALPFRAWSPGCAMAEGRFGTSHPLGDILAPDVILVPLLAFDRHGNRLGYGGGYYDRTLAGLPGRRAVGVAYAAQEVELVPVEAHDRRLDLIVTDHGIVQPLGVV